MDFSPLVNIQAKLTTFSAFIINLFAFVKPIPYDF